MSIHLSRGSSPPDLLLVEPDSLIRSTVAGVCKQLNLARVNQAASVSVAERVVESKSVDLMLVSLNEGDSALVFLERVRSGEWTPVTEVPVAVTAETAHQELVDRVRSIGVKRLLLQPYKIKDVILTIETLRQALEEEA